MTFLRPLLTARLAPKLLLLLLLGACAPAPGVGPSTALKEQLQLILQQQRQQAEQLTVLQQQLAQIQQRADGGAPINETIAIQPEPPRPEPAPRMVIPESATQEINALTASAASYLAAFSDLASGRYVSAETGFQNFLNQFPEHQYSTNARFWLANAQKAQGKLEPAATNLRQILADPGGNAKTPAVLLKLAQIYRQQGQEMQADETMEQLRGSYPDSPEAQHFNRSEPPQ